MSINKYVNKQNIVYPYREITIQQLKEPSTGIGYMDEPKKHYESIRSQIQDFKLYDSIDVISRQKNS